MPDVNEMLEKAREAAGSSGGTLAQAPVLTNKQRRLMEREAKRQAAQGVEPPAAAEPEPTVDPIAQAKALLARGAEIDTAYSEFHEERDAAFERERACLRSYRELRGRHRRRLNDTRWCATPEGQQIVIALKALRVEVDRLSGITSTDVDYEVLWRAREAEHYSDFTECVLAASQPIVSAHGNAEAILVVVNDKQRTALERQGAEGKFFFRAERQTFYPNGYEHRLEVRRVVRELQQLLGRASVSARQERKQTEALLKEHAPGRNDSGGAPLDLITMLSVVEPSPYQGRVDVALYIAGFEFMSPGEMQPRSHRGVVHLGVENGTDDVTGGPAKIFTIGGVIGSLERTLPAPGVRWLIPLTEMQENRGNGKLGLRVGDRIPDSRKRRSPEERQPLALLWHIQNAIWEMERYNQTIGQVFGIEAFQRYDAYRQEKRRPKKGGKPKPGKPAQGAAAPAAETSAEATAPADTDTPDATAAGGTGPAPSGKPKRKRDRGPKADAASGGNGVAPGTAATPAPADGDPPPTT